MAEVLDVEGEARALKLLETADADLSRMTMRWVPGAVEENVRYEGGSIIVDVPVETRGSIELTQRLDEERTVVLEVVQERLVVVFAAIAAAAVLSIIAGVRIVGRPMSALAAHARRIGTGDLTERITVNGSTDEIAELAGEMDRMAQNLLAARARADAETRAKLEATEQLRHAERLGTVGRLAAGMAHELGTPLSVIGGRAKMISQPETTRDDSVQYARVISGQVDRMIEIMRGLLHFARRTPARKQTIDLREVAMRVVHLLGPIAKKQDVKLVLDGEGPATVLADEAQLEQALANIVVNAVQSMRAPGDVVVDVRQRNIDGGDWVCVSIVDHGDGIREDDLPRIFEPFFTTKDVGDGTGLGLSITYGIVEEHGGFVDVESEVGHGTRFTLRFPVVR
jgi:signal transduction histidine kinase